MKMLKTRFRLSMVVLAAATLFVSSCKDDEGPSSYLEFDGSSKALKTGYLVLDDSPFVDGSGNTLYHHELAVVTAGLTPTSGSGDLVDFNFVASSNASDLIAGTYALSEEESCDKFHFSYGFIIIDFSAGTGDGTEYDILSGTLTVAKSGTTYTIDFEGTAAIDGVAANSKAIKFHFSGPFTLL